MKPLSLCLSLVLIVYTVAPRAMAFAQERTTPLPLTDEEASDLRAREAASPELGHFEGGYGAGIGLIVLIGLVAISAVVWLIVEGVSAVSGNDPESKGPPLPAGYVKDKESEKPLPGVAVHVRVYAEEPETPRVLVTTFATQTTDDGLFSFERKAFEYPQGTTPTYLLSFQKDGFKSFEVAEKGVWVGPKRFTMEKAK